MMEPKTLAELLRAAQAEQRRKDAEIARSIRTGDYGQHGADIPEKIADAILAQEES